VMATAAQVTWELGADPTLIASPSGGPPGETRSERSQGSLVR
jgi:hypothetical protein